MTESLPDIVYSCSGGEKYIIYNSEAKKDIRKHFEMNDEGNFADECNFQKSHRYINEIIKFVDECNYNKILYELTIFCDNFIENIIKEFEIRKYEHDKNKILLLNNFIECFINMSKSIIPNGDKMVILIAVIIY